MFPRLQAEAIACTIPAFAIAYAKAASREPGTRKRESKTAIKIKSSIYHFVTLAASSSIAKNFGVIFNKIFSILMLWT
jgi:hypothetical protein